MWEILEFSGCPPQLIEVIRSLHEHATIAVRYNSEGELLPEFAQKKGIRQGSGLSPCLFVLILDFVMRAFEESCAEEGLDHTTWNGYADDIEDKTETREGETMEQMEKEASTAMQQLEGAAGFVGLLVNVPKTEVMGCHNYKPGTNSEQAWKVRVKVKFPGRGRLGVRTTDISSHGWLADAKWSEYMGVQGSIHAEEHRLGEMYPDATMKVLVIDAQEGINGEQSMTATVETDTSAVTLSAALTRLRDQWISALRGIAHTRLVAKMAKAQTPTAAWHAVIESLEREKAFKIADLKKTIQLAIEKEKDEAKATSSPSIHDPIPTKNYDIQG